MSRNRSYVWPIFVVLLGAVILFVALPDEAKRWMPEFLRGPRLHLGLDLAGGTQLDFRISEEEIRKQMAELDAQIAEADKRGDVTTGNDLRAQKLSIEEQNRNLVEAIRTVIERRINGLGVSEAVITPSQVGNEKHLLVECPGVVNVQECINVVGKTIQLEFKEEFTAATDAYRAEVRAKADAALRRITVSGSSLQQVGQDLSTQLGVSYADRTMFFRDQLPEGLSDVWTMKPGTPVLREGSAPAERLNAQGAVTMEEVPGIYLTEVVQPLTQTGRTVNEAPKAFELLAKSESGAVYLHFENTAIGGSQTDTRIATALREMQPGQLKAVGIDPGTAKILFLRQLVPGREEVEASHILVSYKGASAAEPGVTRTKEEAAAKADQLKQQLNQGANFTDLARRESDGPSKSDGGRLGSFGRGVMAPAFEQAAFALKNGQVSEPVETQFGYHIIRLDSEAVVKSETADYDELTVRGADVLGKAEQLIARMKNGEVKSTEPALTLRTIFFHLIPSGWKDTTLDGKHFRHAAVTVDPVTNVPVVQIAFDAEGSKLFQELTKRNIGKRIAIFVGGQLITDPTVNEEISGGTAVITGSRNIEQAQALAQDLNTGAIPAPIHLVGQHTVEATLGAEALQSSLLAALIGTIILMLYMLVAYRFLGLVADIALAVYAVIFFAVLKLPLFLFSGTYIVLTLAGMAGLILSMGMAVDANVLVFERFKEEIRKGKSVRGAVESSFTYAWPAIRDGNMSTLITCAILFLIGTSIIRGFAITLGMGVLLSMFTAITVTRWLLRRVAVTGMAEKTELFGVRRK